MTALTEPTDPATARDAILAHARSLGFQAVGVASADDVPAEGEALRAFIERGYAGDMAWLPRTAERRVSPRALWPEARSVVVVGLNYGPAHDPLRLLERTDARHRLGVRARARLP